MSTFILLLLLSWIIPALSYPQARFEQPADLGPPIPVAASSAILSPADGARSASAAVVGPTTPTSSPDHHDIGPNDSGNADTKLSHNPTVTTSTPLVSSTSSQPTSSETKASSKPPTLKSKDPYDQAPSIEKSSALNYYFLLLALLLGLLVLAYWLINRRKKARIARSRQNSLNALACDLERDRGWAYRDWRNFIGLSNCNNLPAMAATEHREEGLNERGEAPPPYVESVERPTPVLLRRNTGSDLRSDHHRTGEEGLSTEDRQEGNIPDNNRVLGLSIPMRTLSVSMAEAGRPPGYDGLRRGSDAENMLYHSVLRNEMRRDSTRGLLSPSHRGSIATQGTDKEAPETTTIPRPG